MTFPASCPCGWSGAYGSQAKADWNLRRHSCDKQRRRAESAARGAARRAGVDRTPRPCHHKRADHQHGTHATYVHDRCRCHPCSAANRTYEKTRLRKHAYGRFNDWTPASPVRLHILILMRAGVGLKRIAAVSGCSTGALTKIVYGYQGRPPSRRVHVRTANRILAVGIDQHAPGAKVPILGSTRRVQALTAIGYSASAVAQRVGVHPSNFTRVLHGRGEITARTRDAIADLYEQLADTPVVGTDHRSRISVARARNMAARNGWPPPAGWDDDTIDDPTVKPERGRPADRKTRPIEDLIEDLEWLDDTGLTHDAAAERLGVLPLSLYQACHRAGRLDLWERLTRRAEAPVHLRAQMHRRAG